MILLVSPPVAKPCEPPAGIARLAGALASHGVPCRLLDGNLEGLLHLLSAPSTADDTWSRRAATHRERNLALLRDPASYSAPDRYRRAVSDLNRLVTLAGGPYGVRMGLADYDQDGLSPVRSADLLAAAAAPERNPFFPWFSQRLPHCLDGVSLVGFSLTYLGQALTTFAMIGFLRRHAPGLRIILGGGLVSSWLQRPGWSNPFGGLVDELVAGPGEAALLELCGVAPEGLPAPPDYSGLPLPDYLAPGLILPYSTAAGCWWRRCSFCPERAEGNGYHPLPPARALAEITALVATTRPALLHLLDSALAPAFLEALVAAPPGAPWYGFARVTPHLADPEFCRALRTSGCVMLKLGLESGDQQTLDRLEKGLDLALAERVLENLRAAGIAVYGYFLFGTPAEDEAAARRTLAFIRRHHLALTFLNLAIFNMPAHGDEVDAYGGAPFYEGDLSLYTTFRHPAGWDRHRVRRFVDREVGRDPLVAEILRRDPPLFTSNHAPLFAPGYRT